MARQLNGLDRRAVDTRPVRALAVQLRFQQHAAITVRETSPDDRRIRPVAHERGVVGHPVRSERREIGDRLGEIRLSLTVAADEDVRPWTQRDVGDRVVAEVDEAQVFHDHCATLFRTSDP